MDKSDILLEQKRAELQVKLTILQENINNLKNELSNEEQNLNNSEDPVYNPQFSNLVSLSNEYNSANELYKLKQFEKNSLENELKTQKKDLEKMNFILIGNSGVGKSTLINEILGEKLAMEGNGTRTTTKCQKYESKLVPFITILDTMGTEIGSGHKLSDVLEETLNNIMKQLDSNDPNDHVHCILYCTNSNRFFEDELEVLLKIREKYEGKKLPIVIVFTRAIKEEEVESKKKTIDEFLNKHGEKLSDDIFGITFLQVLKNYLPFYKE